MNEMIQLAETHGFAWLISLVAIVYALKRLNDSDKIIANNTKVTEEFQRFLQNIEKSNSLILREQQDQNTVVRQIFDKLQDHDDRSEKIFTQTKLNERLIEAVIRESFDRRTAEKIEQEVKEEIAKK